ncbi:hypothetical protein TNCV_2769011 [Trichonephila clavipes]|nr:hypothetical protein TNCV_2769011 [Trichonephila clavipes]
MERLAKELNYKEWKRVKEKNPSGTKTDKVVLKERGALEIVKGEAQQFEMPRAPRSLGESRFASSRVVEPHLVTFLELMSCGFCVVPSLHLLRPQVDPFSSQMVYIFKTCLRFCTYSSGDEGVSGGRPNSRSQGRRRSRPKASGMVNIR